MKSQLHRTHQSLSNTGAASTVSCCTQDFWSKKGKRVEGAGKLRGCGRENEWKQQDYKRRREENKEGKKECMMFWPAWAVSKVGFKPWGVPSR